MGRKGSGKSFNLVQLLCDKNGLRGLYDEIIIFSGTFKTQYDSLWKKISSKGVTVFEDLTNVEAVYNNQINSYPKKHILLLSDDMDVQWAKMDQQILNRIITNSRHANISMVFLIQKMTMCSTIIRCNADCIASFSSCSFMEFEALYREFSTMEKKIFHKLFTDITALPYHYMTCCMQNGNIEVYDSFKIKAH